MQHRTESTGATAGIWLSLVFSCSNIWGKTHCLKVGRSLCSGDYWATQLKGDTVIILMIVTFKSHLQDRCVMENCVSICLQGCKRRISRSAPTQPLVQDGLKCGKHLYPDSHKRFPLVCTRAAISAPLLCQQLYPSSTLALN